MRPDLKRILFVHIPKCGGSAFTMHLASSRRVAIAPTKDYLYDAVLDIYAASNPLSPVKTETELGFRTGIEQLLCPSSDAKPITHIAPFNHLDLLTAISLYREGMDQILCLLRPPLEVSESMLKYRIGHVLQHPTARDSLELLSGLGTTPEKFRAMAEANDQALYAAILEREKEAMDLANWLLVPFQERADAAMQALINIRKAQVICAPTSKMNQLLGHALGSGAWPAQLPRHNASSFLLDAHPSINIQIATEVLRTATPQTSIEIYNAILNSGALDSWTEQGFDQKSYWQSIDQAIIKAGLRQGKAASLPDLSLSLAAELRTALVENRKSILSLETEIKALRSSQSWIITRPIRATLDYLRGKLMHAPSRLKRISEELEQG
jgi:hypothetical protein